MASDWFGPKQPDLLRTLRLEHGNIRAALDFCLTEPGESSPGLAIAAGLRRFLHLPRPPQFPTRHRRPVALPLAAQRPASAARGQNRRGRRTKHAGRNRG